MFLKSITLQGFKSFAERVTLELPRGVAAVVGPNGSGKSNLADAIRWVLGEQSLRLLRGERLEDVIFAGSETKKSLGMAEVSLTFDNSDGKIPVEYSEVTITRRVYRSGESEFLINRTPCRLKDIQELFLDTGLGRGSLSIIGQGEVEAILSARPEERRAFLEEAAGVSKYRVKKREALIKLSQAEENLVRVEDIIREVESRLGPLAAQAEKAKAYEAVDRRLKEIEARLFAAELAQIERQAEENARALKAREAKRDELEAALRALEPKLAEAKRALDSLDEEAARISASLQELQRRELAARHKGEMARARLERAKADEVELGRRLAALGERIERLEGELAAVKASAREAQKELEPKEAKLRELDEAFAGAESDLSELRRALDQRRQELAAISERLIHLESRLNSLGREELRRDETQGEASARFEELSQEYERELEALGQAKERLAGIERALAAEQEAAARLEQEAAALRRERERVQKALGETRARLQALSARRRALLEMEASREGYHRGVKEALGQAERMGWGLLGAVAELIRVDEELETAIEVALGGAAQYIVAERDEDARLAILHLKEAKAGRATFLPLNTLKVQPLPADARRALESIDGVIGVASELVQVDAACRPAIEYLLGRVVVTRDLDAAMAAARRASGISRAVTLDGDLVVPGGAMTGGSRPARSEGLIGRSRQLEELERAIAREMEQEESFSRALSELEARAAALAQAARQAEEARRRLEIERMSTERDCKEAERSAARIRRELEILRRELERLERDQAACEQEAAALAAEQKAAAQRREELAREVETLQEELERHQSRQEGARRHAEALRLSVMALKQALDQYTRDERRLEAELAEAKRSEAQERARLSQIEKEKAQAGADLQAAAAEAEAARRAREEAEGRLERIRLERKAAKEEADMLSAEAKELQAQLASLSEEMTRLLVERERLEISRAQIEERVRERGFDGLPQAAQEASLLDPGEASALKAEARKLRRELEAMGPVNLASIAEYEEVKKRHAFLSAQRDDLLEAKKKLDQVIARIDKESSEKLQSVLAQVREAFGKTFSRLFGGGRADLLFTDPGDPLESGLEIYVQPPGKRLQNLMALSGGEKALAAIALLFALLEVKPSPFCVLDEIDAALDDHNLERFRDMLVEYSRRTQFLVITHRQATMEGADSLFGVTMEESGVSTLVSLDLARVRSAS